jgi:hypothetical protein
MSVQAYTYEADVHCLRCTSERFGLISFWTGSGPDVSGIERVTDNEGNRPSPVFTTDAWWDPTGEHAQYLTCGTCMHNMDSHHAPMSADDPYCYGCGGGRLPTGPDGPAVTFEDDEDSGDLEPETARTECALCTNEVSGSVRLCADCASAEDGTCGDDDCTDCHPDNDGGDYGEYDPDECDCTTCTDNATFSDPDTIID